MAGAFRIGSIVVNVSDVPRAMAFWAPALDYEPRYDPEPDWVILHPRDGAGPTSRSTSARPAPMLVPHIHLDLYAHDQQAEVERLVGLGARRVEDWPYPEEERDFEVLEDPDGNRFCVIDAPPTPDRPDATPTDATGPHQHADRRRRASGSATPPASRRAGSPACTVVARPRRWCGGRGRRARWGAGHPRDRPARPPQPRRPGQRRGADGRQRVRPGGRRRRRPAACMPPGWVGRWASPARWSRSCRRPCCSTSAGVASSRTRPPRPTVPTRSPWPPPTRWSRGCVGAGHRAPARVASRVAVGSASAVLDDGTTVAALVALNSFGAPHDERTGELLAARHGLGDEFAHVGRPEPRRAGRGPRTGRRGIRGAAGAPRDGDRDRRHRHGRDPHQGPVPEGQRARARRPRPRDPPGAHPARRRHALHPGDRGAAGARAAGAARPHGGRRRLRDEGRRPRRAGRRVGRQRGVDLRSYRDAFPSAVRMG